MQHSTCTYTYTTHMHIHRSRQLNNDSIAHYTSHAPYNTSPTNLHFITTSYIHLGFPTPHFLLTNINTTQHNTTIHKHTTYNSPYTPLPSLDDFKPPSPSSSDLARKFNLNNTKNKIEKRERKREIEETRRWWITLDLFSNPSSRNWMCMSVCWFSWGMAKKHKKKKRKERRERERCWEWENRKG